MGKAGRERPAVHGPRAGAEDGQHGQGTKPLCQGTVPGDPQSFWGKEAAAPCPGEQRGRSSAGPCPHGSPSRLVQTLSPSPPRSQPAAGLRGHRAPRPHPAPPWGQPRDTPARSRGQCYRRFTRSQLIRAQPQPSAVLLPATHPAAPLGGDGQAGAGQVAAP